MRLLVFSSEVDFLRWSPVAFLNNSIFIEFQNILDFERSTNQRQGSEFFYFIFLLNFFTLFYSFHIQTVFGIGVFSLTDSEAYILKKLEIE